MLSVNIDPVLIKIGFLDIRYYGLVYALGVLLTYFYLNDNLETSFVGTAKELNKLKDGLIETIAKIKTGDFVATPGKHVCPNCDFRDICEFRII